MREQVLINITPHETRVASVKNGQLQEIFIERAKNKGVVGNIYLGAVVRVLPGMQGAFVDIGLQRTALLYAVDLVPRREDDDQIQTYGMEVNIATLLTEGQRVLVQVIKDPLGSKGARVTAQISVPARNVVLLPDAKYIGVSQRIRGTDNRNRLRSMLADQITTMDAPGGFILRTAGENATCSELHSDLSFLLCLWLRITHKQKIATAPTLIHQALPLALRTVRDLDWQKVDRVRIDSQETFDHVAEFVEELSPDAVDQIEHYSDVRPIFELYDVEGEIEKALLRKVPLKSGGYLVIDQTEAMTTIDVNTGSFVGNHTLEETVFRTNLEAASALTRQLRLRNLGGIIIVDFIDMDMPEHRDRVMQNLKTELEQDGNKAQANEMSSLGLVEITRKRTSESLERQLTESCPNCDGRGIQKTSQTTCYEIFREILRSAREFGAGQYLVVASQPVIDLLLEEESAGIADLAVSIKKEIKLQVEPRYRQAQYDVVLL